MYPNQLLENIMHHYYMRPGHFLTHPFNLLKTCIFRTIDSNSATILLAMIKTHVSDSLTDPVYTQRTPKENHTHRQIGKEFLKTEKEKMEIFG